MIEVTIELTRGKITARMTPAELLQYTILHEANKQSNMQPIFKLPKQTRYWTNGGEFHEKNS